MSTASETTPATTKKAKRACRVYLVTHADKRVTGILMRTWRGFFEGPPPMAYGATVDEVLTQLEVELRARRARGGEDLDRYLWTETFETATIEVEILPQSSVGKQVVVGGRPIPLSLTYAYAKLASGAYRVTLPRWEWWIVVGELADAGRVLRTVISASFLGEKPKWVYDFRREGPERVLTWTPRSLAKLAESEQDDNSDAQIAEDFPETSKVAEDWVLRAKRRRLQSVVGGGVFNTSKFTRGGLDSHLLIGPSGVGKTTWVRRLAFGLAKGKLERGVRRKRVWATSRTRLMAGMRYVGMWQERVLAIVNELEREGDYLYVGRLVDVMMPQSDGSSILDLLAPALMAGDIHIIAECTPEEVSTLRRRNPALLNLFVNRRLAPPAESEMPDLMAQYQHRKRKNLVLSEEASRALVRFTVRYQRASALPGKVLTFLDWFNQDVERVALEQEGVDVTTVVGAAAEPVPRQIEAAEITAAYSRYTGLPADLIADDVRLSAADLAASLKTSIIGQDAACAVCGDILARFKSGLNDPSKPIASLFFVGPTGVGKTELAKGLTRLMFGDDKRMIRLDMSEYMVPGSADRLLATGPGVNSLATQMRRQPLALVLFDEIEKAHPEVFDMLLGVVGEGRLADRWGHPVDFRGAVIIMTSNLGAADPAAVGFGGGGRDPVAAVRRHFRPEFFNRLDNVVSFAPLLEESVIAIVDLELAKVARRTGLLRRSISLQATAEARALLGKLGTDPTMGARPLRRVIEERVVTPIAILLSTEPGLSDLRLVVDVDPDTPQGADSASLVVRRQSR